MLIQGHAPDALRQIESNSIDTVVTSPPYWWARRYAVPDRIWGGDDQCDHDWWPHRHYHEGGAIDASARFIQGGPENAAMRKESRWSTDYSCHCGAWKGQLGLEQHVEDYVRHLSIVTQQLHRCLKPTGSLWLNLGDTYHKKQAALVPARMAIALADQGWTVRGVIIWDKGGRKPKADRPALTTESIIVAVKATGREQYYYDQSAPYSQDNIWRIPATGRRGHNAGYNIELPKRCIAIGCPPGGIVLDPFAGSGSTAEAAKLLGRKSVGIELNTEYCEVA